MQGWAATPPWSLGKGILQESHGRIRGEASTGMVPKASRAGPKCYISCWQREVLVVLEASWFRSLGIAGAGVAEAWSVGGRPRGHRKLHSLFQTLSPHTTHAHTLTRIQPCPFTIVSSSDGTTQLLSQSARQGPGSSLENYRSVNYILLSFWHFQLDVSEAPSTHPLEITGNWLGPPFSMPVFPVGWQGFYMTAVFQKGKRVEATGFLRSGLGSPGISLFPPQVKASHRASLESRRGETDFISWGEEWCGDTVMRSLIGGHLREGKLSIQNWWAGVRGLTPMPGWYQVHTSTSLITSRGFPAGNEITQWSTTFSVLTWNSQEADPEAPLEHQWLIWVEALIDKWRSKTRWELLNEQMTLWQPELSLARDFWEVTWCSPEGARKLVYSSSHFLLSCLDPIPDSWNWQLSSFGGLFRTTSLTPSSRGFLLAREALLLVTLEPHATTWVNSLAADRTLDFSRTTNSTLFLYL